MAKTYINPSMLRETPARGSQRAERQGLLDNQANLVAVLQLNLHR